MFRILFSICLLSMCHLLMAQEPKLVLPTGHTNAITSTTFSPDNKKILTTSLDGTAKVWDAINGLLLHELSGHTDMVFRGCFSPDGSRILTASNDHTARVWDTENGSQVAILNGHNDKVSFAEFTLDGKRLVTIHGSGSSKYDFMKIWDGNTYALLNDSIPLNSSVLGINMSSKSNLAVIATGNGKPQVWDLENAKLLFELKGHRNRCASALFSHDGKKIVTSSWDSTAKVWDAKSGKVLITMKGYQKELDWASFDQNDQRIITASQDNESKIWDASSGKLLYRLNAQFEINYKSQISQFVPKSNKAIVTLGSGKTLIWDLTSNKISDSLEVDGDNPSCFSFSSDGSRVAIGSANNTCTIWGLTRNNQILTLRSHMRALNWIWFSHDNKNLIIDSGDTTGEVWDPKTSRFIGLSKEFPFPGSLTHDGKKTVSYYWYPDYAEILDTKTDSVLATFKGHHDRINTASFSGDDSKLLTSSRDSTAIVWDAVTGKRLLTLKGHKNVVKTAYFNSNGTKIITSSLDKTARIWDAKTGEVEFILNKHNGPLLNATFSPDGLKAATVAFDSTIIIWDAKNGEAIHYLKEASEYVFQAEFDSTSKRLLTRSKELSLKLWDVETGKLKANLAGHKAEITNAIFSWDGRFIYSVSSDNTAKTWDSQSGELLFSFFKIDSSDYLVTDRFGRYDGSEAARKLLYFTCGTEIIGLDQVKDKLWVPNLAERILKGDTIHTPKLSNLNICGLTPLVEQMHSSNDTVQYIITLRKGGLGETIVYINNIEARRITKEKLQKSGNSYQLNILKKDLEAFWLPNQENILAVKALTASNDISSRSTISKEFITKKQDQNPPNLFALVVGVSDYKGEDLDLKYAAKDAADIANAIQNSASKLLNADGKQHVFVSRLHTGEGRDKFPEKAAIRQVLNEIGTKAKPNDILLIFFAGHGKWETKLNQFFFLTADASVTSATEAISEVGISMLELSDWIQPANMKAQKRILVFDACNSGQAINDLVKVGGDGQNYLAARDDGKAEQIKAVEKLNDKSGLFILSASASNQFAYEMGRYSQGLLTYSLLKAIKEQTDILEDKKFLNVSKWFGAAEKTVETIAAQNGNQQQPQLVSTTNFNIGIVDDEVRSKINMPNEKPFFGRSDFRNSEVRIDNLKLRSLVDKQLGDISARGAETPIVYQPDYEGEDVFALNGDYIVKGNDIVVKVIITQGGTQIKTSFEVKGTNDKLIDLATAIANQSVEWILKNK